MATLTEYERAVQDDVVKRGVRNGWEHRRFEIKRGDPDDMFVRDRRLVLIEFKRPGVGRARQQQELRHSEWRAAGAEVYLVNNREDGYAILA